MRIAITGANGFVGSNLANYLHNCGHDIIAVIRPKASSRLIDPAIEVRFTNYETGLDKALAGAEVVIHNAGSVRTRTFNDMIAANVGTTRRVLQAFNRSELSRRFIYISSQAASRPSENGKPVSESEPSAPVNWYGRSKLLAERLIRAECEKEWTVLRPVPVYGPGERDFLQVFKALKSGISLQIGLKDQLLNLIHIDDLCSLTEACLENPQAANEIFFAADGETYTQREFMAVSARLLGKKNLHLSVPKPIATAVFSLGDLFEKASGKVGLVNRQKMKEVVGPSWVCGIEKARTLLGWEPGVALEEGLTSTFEWYAKKSLL